MVVIGKLVVITSGMLVRRGVNEPLILSTALPNNITFSNGTSVDPTEGELLTSGRARNEHDFLTP